MPTYLFICTDCNYDFEKQALMSDAHALKPICPQCKQRKTVHRNYLGENHIIFEGIKTVGSIADKNSEQKSIDEQHSIRQKQTEYLRKPYEGPLPEGASVMEKDNEGRRKVSERQRKVDPKRF